VSEVLIRESAVGTDPDWLPLLERVPLFAELGPRQLRRVAALGRPRRFGAGATIVRLGAHGDAFYVILEGRALVVRPTGRPLKLGAGDFFGELALIEDTPRSADVIAADDVVALSIGRSAFTKLLRSEAAVTYAVLRTVVSRLRADERSPAWYLGNATRAA
jgi:CRP-like cAMP-binding protein